LLKLVVKGEEFPKKLASMWFTEEDVDAEEWLLVWLPTLAVEYDDEELSIWVDREFLQSVISSPCLSCRDWGNSHFKTCSWPSWSKWMFPFEIELDCLGVHFSISTRGDMCSPNHTWNLSVRFSPYTRQWRPFNELSTGDDEDDADDVPDDEELGALNEMSQNVGTGVTPGNSLWVDKLLLGGT
jgi:hypothetical protein